MAGYYIPLVGTPQISDSGGGGGGGGSAYFIIHESNELMLDKTFKQIKDAWDSGMLTLCVSKIGEIMYPTTMPDTEHFMVSFASFSNYSGDYVAASENDYPVFDQ